MRHSAGRYFFEHYRHHLVLGCVPGLLLAVAGCSDTGASAGDHASQAGVATASLGASAVSAEVDVAEPVQQAVQGRWPAAAFNGTHYLVAWEDFRTRRSILYAARVGADGEPLDGEGFPILDTVPQERLQLQYAPAVASDGTDFLVVTDVDGEIRCVRVSSAGEVLDPDGFVIVSTDDQAWRPAVASDGEQYLVVWAQMNERNGADGNIYWTRVTPDGTVLDPGGVRGYPIKAGYTRVAVSFDGTNHLLSWLDLDAETGKQVVYAARIGVDGAPVDEAAFRVSPSGTDVDDGSSPVAGFDGTNHVILWQAIGADADGYEQYEITAGRVSPQGTVLDPAGILVATESAEAMDVNRLDIAAASGRSAVAWSMDYGGEGGPAARPLQLAQIAASGTVSAHPASELARGLEATLVEHAGGGLLLWRDGASPYEDHTSIIGARLDTTGTPVAGEVAPASTASRQDVRAVASDGQMFFVVWGDTRVPEGDGRALFGGRIAADGTPLDGEGIQLTTYAGDIADVVFDGASFVVTWVRHTGGEGDGDPFQSQRVSRDGELLGISQEPPLLSSPDATLASASDGTHTLLVGRDYNSATNVLAAVLVDQDGVAASSVVSIVEESQSYAASEPAVSFAGDGYLVVWHVSDEVIGQLVSATGALVGGHFRIVDKGESIYRVDVTSGGGNHLVLWQDSEALYATRVSPAGEVLDPEGVLITQLEPLCSSLGGCCTYGDRAVASCASVAFDGTSFTVAWRAPAVPGDLTTVNLYGAELSLAGNVLRTFPISEGPEREGVPFLVAGDGQVLAAYTRFVPGAPYDTRRVRARLLTSEGPGPGPDAGPPGPAPDAGTSPADPPGDGGDCGCTVGAAQPTPVAPLLLLGGVIALWLVRRRSAR